MSSSIEGESFSPSLVVEELLYSTAAGDVHSSSGEEEVGPTGTARWGGASFSSVEVEGCSSSVEKKGEPWCLFFHPQRWPIGALGARSLVSHPQS